MKNSVGQKVVVEIEKQYTDTMKMGNTELYVDPLYRRTENITYCGIIKAIPTNIPCSEFNFDNKIDPILKVGDKVYFKFAGADNPIYVMDKDISDTSSKMTLSLFYCWILCAIREGEIVPVGGWCFGEPVIEGEGVEEELMLESGVLGKIKVQYYNGTKIIKEVNEKRSKYLAKVVHVGSFIGHKPSIKPGDLVYCKNQNSINFVNTIEGKEYYCFEEDQIDAIIVENSGVTIKE
jgi:hypothetical protein